MQTRRQVLEALFLSTHAKKDASNSLIPLEMEALRLNGVGALHVIPEGQLDALRCRREDRTGDRAQSVLHSDTDALRLKGDDATYAIPNGLLDAPQFGFWHRFCASKSHLCFDMDALRLCSVEPIYVIPERLLDALKCRVGDRFSDDELDLERRFARYCQRSKAVAIFLGRFQQFWLLCPEMPPIGGELIQHLGENSWGSTVGIKSALEAAQQLAASISVQLSAYSGWLITNPIYLAERDALRQRWEKAVVELGHIPKSPVNQFLKTCGVTDSDSHDWKALIEDFTAFFERWQLTTLTTWDLPLPIGVNIGAPGAASKLIGVADAPVVQLPPTVKLPWRFPLSDLVHTQPADHLTEWKAIQKKRTKSHVGYRRWQRILQVQFLRNVVLAASYKDRLRRCAGKLDWAFADYFDEDTDENMRKLRLFMNRRLKPNALSRGRKQKRNR